MALRARNASPWLLATLSPQSTCHGPRPGPTLSPWCSGGLPACYGAESTRKFPRPEEKKNADVQKKTHLCTDCSNICTPPESHGCSIMFPSMMYVYTSFMSYRSKHYTQLANMSFDQKKNRSHSQVYLKIKITYTYICLLYTSPSPRDQRGTRMPSSA